MRVPGDDGFRIRKTSDSPQVAAGRPKLLLLQRDERVSAACDWMKRSGHRDRSSALERSLNGSQERFARNSEGVMPAADRKARVKALWS